MSLSVNNLTVDCRDPRMLSEFWTAALGWQVVDQNEDGVMIAPYADRHPGVYPVYFQANPDAKIVKNRWHFDLAPDDQWVEVARLEALGATRADIGQGDVPWVVMADIEGNEFCVLTSAPPEQEPIS
jgi:catechol 2,3-dioxygenase-like lactoylglutathione lyase family enzyme